MTQNNPNDLMPCPFCDGEDLSEEFREPEIGMKWLHYIECFDCSCCGPDYEDKKEAIKAWNTRTQKED